MSLQIELENNITPANQDYQTVCDVIEYISKDFRAQPSLENISKAIGRSPFQLQKTFTRWAGLSPKEFLQAVTLDQVKKHLRDDNLPLLDASFEVGLSGPSRLHDLFISHESMSPGIWKAKGAGLSISYGFHDCPFGVALIMTTDRGLAGLAFCNQGEEAAALGDMCSRWPNADFGHDQEATTFYAERIFNQENWSADHPLRIVLIGTDFQIQVWEALMKIPLGGATTYSGLASDISNPKAVRAVGAAVGRNPISFVVPCHRALGKSGALTGYHWGLTRKRAMLGWEAAKSSY